jgi:hypothetical protein
MPALELKRVRQTKDPLHALVYELVDQIALTIQPTGIKGWTQVEMELLTGLDSALRWWLRQPEQDQLSLDFEADLALHLAGVARRTLQAVLNPKTDLLAECELFKAFQAILEANHNLLSQTP